MDSEPVTPTDLEPECRRVGVDLYEGLRQLVNLNLHPGEKPTEHGEAVNIEMDLPHLHRVLRSLPDGAGTDRFVEAVMQDSPRKRGRGPWDPGGPGA
jgi:hypothetical protein